MDFSQAAFRASQAVALQAHGTSQFEFSAGKQASSILDRDFGRQLAFIGDMAMLKAGGAHSPYRLLLNSLWKEDVWTPEAAQLVEPVKMAAAQLERMEKEAAGIGTVTSFLSQAGADAKDGSLGLLGALLLLSGTGGASLGALNWHMRRGAEESDEKNESLRAGIQHMRDERKTLQAMNQGRLAA